MTIKKYAIGILLTASLVLLVFSTTTLHAWSWSTTSTVTVKASNNNWLQSTYCTGAYLRDPNGGAIKYYGSIKNVWRGCTVTFNDVVNKTSYRLDIRGYVDRTRDRDFALVKDVYISRPSVGNTVDLGTIGFNK